MNRVIILDTGPLGLVTNPKISPESIECATWLQNHINSGSRVIIPEIADYEVRRELLRANKIKGIARLDDLAKFLEYLPITTNAMRKAAELWAKARQQGQPTAGDKTIDGDMILVSQAITLGVPDVVIATTNIGHLSRFIKAELWQNIS
ncbi:PIN domain-containing protein [Cronbergia sp. UHCC 0137]|uniref:PIN domain-containing protein n=1 Tax=Cronbergia sp. UHCC 0137 TaxID=3110239 RepID=UPI002B1FBE3E|nr:PIN domain-containing protein [Cronbergia sp. UHCC 0137]MEA5619217.1 PIN domain-containing protein [Cronbergia sp. UHCC 0137]